MWDFGWARRNTKKFYRKEASALEIVAVRLLFVIVLILVVAIIFWYLGESHLEDTSAKADDKEFSFVDSLYFTIVTVTTLGYGDIVPVTEEARMFDAFIITPVRIIVWVLFIGTAYQLVIQNYWERFRMNRAMNKLHEHVIVAGYGATGSAAVSELLINNYNEDNLVVIDSDEQRVSSASEAGATGIVGDPTREESLNNAGIKTAGVLIVATHQDDTNVLITLTAKDLNPKVKVISRVSQEENIKQLKRAGADLIISPSLTGGNLMAMAVAKSNSVSLMSDLLTTSRGANVVQRSVRSTEVGKPPKSLTSCVVLGVVRAGKNIGPKELDGVKLKGNDELIIVE